MNAPRPPTDPAVDDPSPLLLDPLARALATPVPDPGALRQRLLQRTAATQAAEAALRTQRLRRLTWQSLAAGVQVADLYRAAAGAPLRPGEPLCVRLLQLAPGSRWQAPPAPGVHREWLVMDGASQADAQPLQALDYLVTPAGQAAPAWYSPMGARLFLRESPRPEGADEAGRLVRDADAGWPAFAPGIERRVLWQRGGQAALLYRAAAGAAVPRHTHGHDEECLMVRGELFLDDLLLQPGDYQLAPAGTGHAVTHTEGGAVLFAHGDADLRFV